MRCRLASLLEQAQQGCALQELSRVREVSDAEMPLYCWHKELSFLRHTGKQKHCLVPEAASWEAANQELASPLRGAVRACNQNTVSSASKCNQNTVTSLCVENSNRVLLKPTQTEVAQEHTELYKKQNKSGSREQIRSLGFMYTAV